MIAIREPTSSQIRFRAFDACKSAAATGVPILLAMSSALVERSLEGGLVIVGGLNLGGSVEPIYNAVSIIELAADCHSACNIGSDSLLMQFERCLAF